MPSKTSVMVDWENTFRKLRKEDHGPSPNFPFVDTDLENVALETKSETPGPIQSGTRVEQSEKEQVLKGLKELAEEKEKETGEGIKFKGGEVKVKESPLESSEKIDQEASSSPEKKRVLFVYNYSSDALELAEEQRDQAPSEQLLRRMITAMKMSQDDFELLVIEEGKRDLVFSKLAETEFEILVPMGAVATNLVLDRQERISKIHGKFFTRELVYKNDQVRQFQVVPVFNPEMILINPNMKRSTWVDLQKIMEKLGISLD